MVLMRRQAQLIIDKFNNLNNNQQVHTANPIKYVIIPFGGNISPRDSTELKISLQATRDTDKGTDKLDISVSNTKDVIYFFPV